MRTSTDDLQRCDESVVITGAGLTTSLGLNRRAVWRAILAGQDGIAPLCAVESQLDPNKGGGEAPALHEPNDEPSRREVTYLRHIIAEALGEAGLRVGSPYAAQRCGVILGTTLHGMRNGGRFLRTGDFAHLRGFLAGAVLREGKKNAGFDGLNVTTCSACSSGLAAISLACTMLGSGELDCVLAGGYDAISEYAYAGFNSMRLVSSGDIRPFSRHRDGMKVAEGYGVVILEREEDAVLRRTRILSRIVGVGESCDSFHLSKPHPEGAGAAAAIRTALHAVDKEHVDLIVAHATATPDNDAAEYLALKQVFGERLSQVPVIAFKSYFGHTLGGAGAVELICALSAMEEGVCPPCLQVDRNDVAYEGLALAVGQPRPMPLRRVMCTSLGFGGANVAVLLESPLESRGSKSTRHGQHIAKSTSEREVMVAGIGILLPAGMQSAAGGEAQSTSPAALLVSDDIIEALLQAKRVRRMSRYAKLTLAAAALGLQDAQLSPLDPLPHGGAILATTHGSSAFCETYYRQLIAEGCDAANPLLFSEGVPNVAAAHVSTAFGIRGFCQTLIGTRTTGLDALRLAAARIRRGEWTGALVVAAEEHHEVVTAAYRENWSQRARRKCDPHSFFTGEGAVAFVLEARASAQSRGVKTWGELGSTWNALEHGGQPSAGPFRIDDSEPTVICVGGNWVWGRLERIAARAYLRKLGIPVHGRVESLPCDWPELFSVGPMAALARWLKDTGREGKIMSRKKSVCVACDHEGFSSTVTVAKEFA